MFGKDYPDMRNWPPAPDKIEVAGDGLGNKVVDGGKRYDLSPGAINKVEGSPRQFYPLFFENNVYAPKRVDCSAGDRPRVIISDTTAILMAEAFIDMANAKRLFVDNLEASEAMTRAFGEIELLQKVIENRDGVVA